MAQEVREALELDVVVLIPTSVHAFKGPASASPRHRAAMTELAAGDPGLKVDRIEVQRGGTSYTVETLRSLRERERDGLDPDPRTGQPEELPQWRESEACRIWPASW